jgi:hypothetical protein
VTKKSNGRARFIVLPGAVIFLAALVICCSPHPGSGPGAGPGVSVPPVVLTGVFVDGPVGGINYSTSTIKGVTRADGAFEYRTGETVTFSIGALTLGCTKGKPRVTPLDIVPDATNTFDQRVVNICVVLQTLDQDGNADNGILINQQVASFVSRYGREINFNKPVHAFSFDAGFRNVMAELNNIDAFGTTPRAVKPPALARKHLEASLANLKIN